MVSRCGVWAGIFVVALAGTAAAQFSPGPLSRAHAGIDGVTNCFKCHEPRKTTTAERCLVCHEALAARITAGTGLHGHMGAATRARCGACHAEHGGRAAPLVVWAEGQRDAFDHRRTGFDLTGKHASLRCNACHEPGLVRAADVRAEKNLKMTTTFLGLSTRCDACHRDEHRGQLATQIASSDCAGCHDSQAWKPARFDHATARFALTGRHAGLECAQCHRRENAAGQRVADGTTGAFVRYRPLVFETCANCHADAHAGQLGNDCVRCHTPAGWTQVTTAGFDHDRTRFPLHGKHRAVNCSQCHSSAKPGAKARYKPLEFSACTACHRNPHRDAVQFGPDCARCHSPAGWAQITPGAFDHDKTAYPLRGLHRQVACDRCHRSGDRGQRLAHDRCSACHADAHSGELAHRDDRGACEACHTVDGFVPARFGPREHESTRFPLRGAHRAVACIDCHRETAGAAGRGAAPRLRLGQPGCVVCHADVHGAQFADASGVVDCARCHAETTWRLPKFDHDKTRFRLEGAHARAQCGGCHRGEVIAGRTRTRYRPLDTACRACHGEARLPGR